MTHTLTRPADLAGITAASACDGCGNVLPATALRVIDEAERRDPGYARCADCSEAAERGTPADVREREIAELAAALALQPFYANVNHAEQARQMLGYPAPDGDELL